MTRKKMVIGLFSLFASIGVMLCCFVGCSNDTKPTLYLYTWADYIDPNFVERFERENNCSVCVDTFDCNEAAFAKLMAGADGYDIVVPTTYIIPALKKANLIEKFDLDKLPNVKTNFDMRLKTEKRPDMLEWYVPYAFSLTGILYRKDKVPVDLKFEDWNDMFDPRLHGRICILNDIREIIGLGLKMNGFSVNSHSSSEIAKATTVAKDWKYKCVKMDNEAYRTGIMSAEFYTAMAYASDAIQLMIDDQEILSFTVPTNGTTCSFDSMVILKNSRQKELAYKFINDLYEVKTAAKNAEYICAPVPVAGIDAYLSDDYKKIPFTSITDEVLKLAEDIEDIGDSLDLYTKAWDQIKSIRK
jgi:spermidine/putrescine transport system substrate-binding protein